jgi:hypothetical protein
LLLKTCNFRVDILNRFEVELAFAGFEFVEPRLELLIVLLDLFVDGAARGLVALLGLSNGV